jgi:isoquinoline 1-oxidoreductase beta subunit
MLREAAAQAWQVSAEEISTEAGVLYHRNSGREAGYGEMAAAAARFPVPEKPPLKEPKDFKIIGHSQRNVDGQRIVTGKPMFGLDYRVEGMRFAMVVHPPAFGLRLKSVDDSAAKAMPGILDVFPIKTYPDGIEKNMFDTNAFPELVAVTGRSTWEVMNARKALNIVWEPAPSTTDVIDFRGSKRSINFPAGLESSADHTARMAELAARPGRVVRRDGNPEAAFERASRIIERTYSCPHLAHNCMEPMNFFADVKGDRAKVAGPLQAPGLIEPTLAASLGIPVENIEIELTRMGGGFGRRAYSHYLVEAALISQRMQAPVLLVYSREDDMTGGIYRPAYQATYRAALDADNRLIGFHVKAGGVPESPLFANRFPAGAVDNYLAEEWSVDSNITTGAFRAPRSNFIAGAEQSFLDELAEAMGTDPIDLRLDMLKKAQANPVGERNEYDAARYAGVLELVRDKSGWHNPPALMSRGVAAYFCHNTYAAHVLDLQLEEGLPVVHKVTSALDCGIVVNPDAARNMVEGAVTDGIGQALFGKMSFRDGVPEKSNFDRYRMIRMREAPKSVEVHFVENEIHPTGMGEPPFPPIFGALANALYRATGKRYYEQPFVRDGNLSD